MSNGHGPEAAMTDRPARAIEHAIHRTNDQAMQADNIRHRLAGVADRLVHGEAPKLEAVRKDLNQPTEAPAAEISQLHGNLDRLDSMLQQILDTVNVLEGV